MADNLQSDPRPSDAFRWTALFQHAQDACFLLNQHKRILSVNRVWEELTGLRYHEVRGLACVRRPAADAGPADTLTRCLCPPAEVIAGRPARVRRRLPAGPQSLRWWDIDFFPLRDGRGRLRVLGKIIPVDVTDSPSPLPLPEKLSALRERLDLRHGLEQLGSSLLPLRRIADQVRLAAQTGAHCLLVGEPGTGKEGVARAIHHQGRRREQGFAALDCRRLPPAALESALFGEGGILRLPGISLLYLKDLEHLPRDLQARLHEHLEADSLRLSIAAGCGTDPADAVRSGRLLDRLHCALSTLVLALPPLRERLDDLPWLVEKFLERLQSGEDAKTITGLTPSAWERLRGYSWPGNLHELHDVLAAARARTAGDRIDAGDLPAYLNLALRLEQIAEAAPPRRLPLDQILETVERRLLTLALQRARGNKSRAADLLAIWRPRLLRRLEALGLDTPAAKPEPTGGAASTPDL